MNIMNKYINLYLLILLIPIVSFGQIKENAIYQDLGLLKITTDYHHQSPFFKWYYDSSFYEKARLNKIFECRKLFYKSDTANVEAWIYQPVQIPKGKKYPLIIYNRGGMGNFGNLAEENMVDFYNFALKGYVILASKTRFAGANGKYDEHGGIDVDDIVHLKNVYSLLPYIDTVNIFMYGFSRGGQNTYQASLKLNLNAMAVTAGTTDWISRINERREFVDGWTDEDSTLNYEGFAKVFPSWASDSINILKARSAIYWADKINTPVLILQSRQDDKVPCYQSLEIAEKLQQYNKEYEMVIYNEASHSLPFRYFDSFDRICNWFQQHKK